jgi:thioesterase domain-containing protein
LKNVFIGNVPHYVFPAPMLKDLRFVVEGLDFLLETHLKLLRLEQEKGNYFFPY